MARNEPKNPRRKSQMKISCSVNSEQSSFTVGEFVGAKNNAIPKVMRDANTTTMKEDWVTANGSVLLVTESVAIIWKRTTAHRTL